MIKWCTHTEGVLSYVVHAVVYHHLWCGPAVASHQKSHAPVVCLGPRWWFYSSSTIFWLILDMGRDGMEALLHVGWQSPVAASNGNDIIGRGCTGEFSCAKAGKKFWFHVRKKKKKPKKHHEKKIRATPKIGDFFSFGDGGQYPPVGVILRIIRATPKLVISSFDNGGLYPHVGVILRS